MVHGREAQVYMLDNGRDYDKKMVKDHLNSIGVDLISWKELERNPNQVIGVGAVTVLLHPEPQV